MSSALYRQRDRGTNKVNQAKIKILWDFAQFEIPDYNGLAGKLSRVSSPEDSILPGPHHLLP